jgi:hypothetical protein
MDRRGRFAMGCPLGVLLLASCQDGPPPTEIVTRGAALVSRNVTLNLTVPAGTDVASFALAANGSLLLEDRAVVNGPISNMGSSGTSIGIDAQTVAVSSLSTIAVRDRARVSGPVNTTVPLQASPSSQITGPINTHATLSPPAVHTLAVLYPTADTSDVTVAPDQTAAAAPGRYGAVTVRSRAHLRQRRGTYYLESFTVEPQAVVDLDERSGPLVIYVNLPF